MPSGNCERYYLEDILYVEQSPLYECVGTPVCVTGGREFDDKAFVWGHLDDYHSGEEGPILELGAGCARGVDKFALEWAEEHSVAWRKYYADWKRFGDPAGIMRNEVMLVDFKPKRLLVFPGHIGTTDCTRRARKKEILRTFYNQDTGDLFADLARWG